MQLRSARRGSHLRTTQKATTTGLTILEDRKVWGSIPREITYLGATAAGLCTGLLVFAAIVTGIWIFWLGVGAGAMLLKVTFYLRALPYEAYEGPTPPEVFN